MPTYTLTPSIGKAEELLSSDPDWGLVEAFDRWVEPQEAGTGDGRIHFRLGKTKVHWVRCWRMPKFFEDTGDPALQLEVQRRVLRLLDEEGKEIGLLTERSEHDLWRRVSKEEFDELEKQGKLPEDCVAVRDGDLLESRYLVRVG